MISHLEQDREHIPTSNKQQWKVEWEMFVQWCVVYCEMFVQWCVVYCEMFVQWCVVYCEMFVQWCVVYCEMFVQWCVVYCEMFVQWCVVYCEVSNDPLLLSNTNAKKSMFLCNINFLNKQWHMSNIPFQNKLQLRHVCVKLVTLFGRSVG